MLWHLCNFRAVLVAYIEMILAMRSMNVILLDVRWKLAELAYPTLIHDRMLLDLQNAGVIALCFK